MYIIWYFYLIYYSVWIFISIKPISIISNIIVFCISYWSISCTICPCLVCCIEMVCLICYLSTCIRFICSNYFDWWIMFIYIYSYSTLVLYIRIRITYICGICYCICYTCISGIIFYLNISPFCILLIIIWPCPAETFSYTATSISIITIYMNNSSVFWIAFLNPIIFICCCSWYLIMCGEPALPWS